MNTQRTSSSVQNAQITQVQAEANSTKLTTCSPAWQESQGAQQFTDRNGYRRQLTTGYAQCGASSTPSDRTPVPANDDLAKKWLLPSVWRTDRAKTDDCSSNSSGDARDTALEDMLDSEKDLYSAIDMLQWLRPPTSQQSAVAELQTVRSQTVSSWAIKP